MTEHDRIARAQRAQAALDEFLGPVVDEMRETYTIRLREVATQELGRDRRTDKITALSTALTLLDNLSAHIAAAVKDGEVAAKDIERMEKRNNLTGPQRRLLSISPLR